MRPLSEQDDIPSAPASEATDMSRISLVETLRDLVAVASDGSAADVAEAAYRVVAAVGHADTEPIDCPVMDPDCLGGDGDCHDACEWPDQDAGLVDMRQVLPGETQRVLSESFVSVLTMSAARGADTPRQASWLATFVAPWLAERGVEHAHVQRAADLTATRQRLVETQAELADARTQLAQAGAALDRAVAEATRLGDLAHARHEVAQRLRDELFEAVADSVPTGRHHARPASSPSAPAGPAARGGRTLTVTWAPVAVEGAVERARVLVGDGDPAGAVGPIAWMDLACLVDTARAVLREAAAPAAPPAPVTTQDGPPADDDEVEFDDLDVW